MIHVFSYRLLNDKIVYVTLPMISDLIFELGGHQDIYLWTVLSFKHQTLFFILAFLIRVGGFSALAESFNSYGEIEC